MKFTHEFDISIDTIPGELFQEFLGYVDYFFLDWHGDMQVTHLGWDGPTFNLLEELDSTLSQFDAKSIGQAEECLEFCGHFDTLFLECLSTVKETKARLIEHKKALETER